MKFRGVKKSLLLVTLLYSLPASLLGKDINEVEQEAENGRAVAAMYANLAVMKNFNYSDVLELGLKNGALNGTKNVIALSIQAVAAPLVQDLSRPLSSCIKYPFDLLTKMTQNIVFGSQRLTWNEVARLNNTVYELIQPLTVQSIGDFTKERRADLIAAKKDGAMSADIDWQLRKERVLQELDYIISGTQKKIMCYSPLKSHGLRKKFQQLYNLFAVEQREEIATYLTVAKQYCQDIKKVISSVSTFKALEDHRDLLKFYLSRALRAYKMVSIFIDEDIASLPAGAHQKGYMKFQELSAQGSSALAGLDELFAGAGANGSGNN